MWFSTRTPADLRSSLVVLCVAVVATSACGSSRQTVSPTGATTDGAGHDTASTDAVSGNGAADARPADAAVDAVSDGSEDAGIDAGRDVRDAGDAAPDVECSSDDECKSGVCEGGSCKPPACDDGVKNGDESDIDCGGKLCRPCPADDSCKSNSDCQSGVCAGATCQKPACDDNIQNGSETDVDCGGSDCSPCGVMGDCRRDGDCTTKNCDGGKCVGPTCMDGQTNGKETASDCGGPMCPGCKAGEACGADGDCKSGVCKGGTCEAGTCKDGVQNNGESDTDCGGPNCGPCAAMASCNKDGDCKSGVCKNGTCQKPTCSDGTKNGKETDVDCGGKTCSGCAPMKSCGGDSDCKSRVCKNGTCQKPSCSDGVQNGNEKGTDCGGSCKSCGPKLTIEFSDNPIQSKLLGGKTKVDCYPVDKKGNRKSPPGDIKIAAPSKHAKKLKPRTYAFAREGNYKVTCSSQKIGQSVSAQVTVVHPGVQHEYVGASQAMQKLPRQLERIYKENAYGKSNKKQYEKAVDQFEKTGKSIPFLKGVSFLFDAPDAWPSSAKKLKQAGLKPTPQKDTKWVNAVKQMRTYMDKHRKKLKALSSNKQPSKSDVQAIEQIYRKAQKTAKTIASTSPSAYAVWKHRAEVKKLIAAAAKNARIGNKKMVSLFRAFPPVKSRPGSFTLASTLSAMKVQAKIRSMYWNNAIKPGLKVITANFISMTIKNVINASLPKGTRPPKINSIHGNAAGFLDAGNPFRAVGRFNSDYRRMVFVFIPPSYSNCIAQKIFDVLSKLKKVMKQIYSGNFSGNGLLALRNKVEKAIKSIEKLVDAAGSLNSKKVLLHPSNGGKMFLKFPPLPRGLNCSFAPVAGTIYPIDRDAGFGDAVNVNVLGNDRGCPPCP